MLGLSLVLVSPSLWYVGFSLWWLLSLRSTGSRHTGFSSCGTRAQYLWRTGLVSPQDVGSSQARDPTHVPCIGRQLLNHCATREFPQLLFLCPALLTKPHPLWPRIRSDLVRESHAQGRSWLSHQSFSPRTTMVAGSSSYKNTIQSELKSHNSKANPPQLAFSYPQPPNVEQAVPLTSLCWLHLLLNSNKCFSLNTRIQS